MCPDDTTPPGTSDGDDPGAAAELLPALWIGSTAQVHGPGTGDYTGRVVRVVSDRGRRWTVETSDGIRLKIDPKALRRTDQPFVSTAPVYVPGSVVTIDRPTPVYPAGQRFVVTAVRATTLTVAKLGGDRGITFQVPPGVCRPADAEAASPSA